MKRKVRIKRKTAAWLAAAVAFQAAVPVQASPDMPPCDETLYITMDEYGSIRESSVVKSYSTNGALTIVDYGIYDQITNMTDHSVPLEGEDGRVTFQLEKPADRFYFEGAMKVEEEALPWNISVSYRLNGVEKRAEELPGTAGLVEINVDLTPNQGVSDYYRNNMTMMATAIVDLDKNLSLEAPGAQVQAMGNINAVVFFALPGEERSYSIRIGTEDFEFSGLAFTMVPLTVAQLDRVADLRDAKETLEDSADAISDSLDVVLDTLGGMRQSLSDTADGVRMLNETRQIFADSKGRVYDDADRALDDLYDFSQKLKPFSEHAKEARGLLSDLKRNLNDLMDSLEELSPLLADLREDIRSLRVDVEKLRDFINSPAVDLGAQAVISQMEKVKSDLETLRTGQQALTEGITGIASALPQLLADTGSLKTISASDSFSKSELKELVSELSEEEFDDEDDLASFLFNEMDYSIDEIDSLVGYLAPRLGMDSEEAKERRISRNGGESSEESGTSDSGAAAADEAEAASPASASPKKDSVEKRHAGMSSSSDRSLPPEVQGSLAEALQAIVAGTRGTVGNTALTDDATAVADSAESLLKALAEQRPAVSGALKNVRDLAETAEEICGAADDIISGIDDLNITLNRHHDELMQTLKDAGEMTDSASNGLNSLIVFSTSLENQLKSISEPLNNGTKRTLDGLAGALDQADAGLSQTDILRNAKNTVKEMIKDKWDEYTEEDTTILNIDLDAAPVSFTSARNPAPRTIQVVLRTGEIKKDKADTEVKVDESFRPEGNIFQRMASILRRIWEAIAGFFRK